MGAELRFANHISLPAPHSQTYAGTGTIRYTCWQARLMRALEGYLISWPKMEAYFIDNIAVDPARQGLGLGRQLMEYAA